MREANLKRIFTNMFSLILICSSFSLLVLIHRECFSSTSQTSQRKNSFCGFISQKYLKKASLICCTTTSKTARTFISTLRRCRWSSSFLLYVHDVVVVFTPIVLWFYFISWIFITYYTTSSDCGRRCWIFFHLRLPPISFIISDLPRLDTPLKLISYFIRPDWESFISSSFSLAQLQSFPIFF